MDFYNGITVLHINSWLQIKCYNLQTSLDETSGIIVDLYTMKAINQKYEQV